MRIAILGIDGYIGWSLALDLLNQGHTVSGIDNESRRVRVAQVGGNSLTPIASYEDRFEVLSHYSNYSPTGLLRTHLHDRWFHIRNFLYDFQPDVIVHLAQMPSAPYSMKDQFVSVNTQTENVAGNFHLLWAMREACPNAHLIKLGTMGEYGTPNCDIPEGFIPKKCIGRGVDILKDPFDSLYVKPSCPMANLPFPKSPGSFYHLSKVFDSENIRLASKLWDITCTDIMQGVVFGLNEVDNNDLLTRFDYDEYFGTVLNRFCAQAIIGYPLTIYGNGQQTRGYLPLSDSLKCINLIINNPPKQGEYRVINQFALIYTVEDLAMMVKDAAKEVGIRSVSLLNYIPNPRVEDEGHYYNPKCETLKSFEYEPITDAYEYIVSTLIKIRPYSSRVNKSVIEPKTKWR